MKELSAVEILTMAVVALAIKKALEPSVKPIPAGEIVNGVRITAVAPTQKFQPAPAPVQAQTSSRGPIPQCGPDELFDHGDWKCKSRKEFLLEDYNKALPAPTYSQDQQKTEQEVRAKQTSAPIATGLDLATIYAMNPSIAPPSSSFGPAVPGAVVAFNGLGSFLRRRGLRL